MMVANVLADVDSDKHVHERQSTNTRVESTM